MRRYIFYLAVALLAFGIGSFVVFYSFFNSKIVLAQTTQTKSTKQPINSSDMSKKSTDHLKDSDEEQEEQKIHDEFAEYEENGLKKPYKKIIQKWLNGKEIKKYVSLRTGEEPTEKEPINATAEINLFDLNNDGKKEMAVRSFCTATGNCSCEIYKRNGQAYRTILTASEIQQVKVQSNLTNSYHDLHLRTHNTAFSSYHQIFKFSGRTYERKKCWWVDYMAEDKNGNWHEVKKPIIHYVKCGEYEYVN